MRAMDIMTHLVTTMVLRNLLKTSTPKKCGTGTPKEIIAVVESRFFAAATVGGESTRFRIARAMAHGITEDRFGIHP